MVDVAVEENLTVEEIETVDIPDPPDDSINDNESVLAVEEMSSIPSLVCEGFSPELPKLFESFPFQLLPSIPQVVLSGEVFHHRTCSDGHFHLVEMDGAVNKKCASLEKDEKFSAMLARSSKSLKDIPAHTNNIFLTHTTD